MFKAFVQNAMHQMRVTKYDVPIQLACVPLSSCGKVNNKRAEPNHPDQVVEGNERLQHCSKHKIKFKLLNKLWYIFFINVCLINLLSVALQKKCFDIYCMFTRFLLTFLLPTKNHVLEVYCELTTSISYQRGPFSFGPCQAVINDLAVP